MEKKPKNKPTPAQISARKKAGACLRMWRAYAGMSQTQAAKAINVHMNTIQRLESGAAVDIGVCAHLMPLCDAYGADPCEIIDAIRKAYIKGDDSCTH